MWSTVSIALLQVVLLVCYWDIKPQMYLDSGSWPWPLRVTWCHQSHDHLIPYIQFIIDAPLTPTLSATDLKLLRHKLSGSRHSPLSVINHMPLKCSWKFIFRFQWLEWQ